MLNQTSIKQKFLDKFTKEIVLNLAMKFELKEKSRLEEERRRKSIELEKLKQKFESYGERRREQPIVQQTTRVMPPSIKPQPTQRINPLIKQQVPNEKSLVHEVESLDNIPKQKPIMIQETNKDSSKQEKPLVHEVESLPIKKEIKPEQKPIVAQQIKPEQKPAIPPAPRPFPGEINFGRLLIFTRDPLVDYIECQGTGKNIIIRRAANTISTKIILSKEEINSIIQAFSEKAKIPLIGGLLNARADNFEISAVVSEVISPSFIIKKISFNQGTMGAQTTEIAPLQGALQRPVIPQYSNQSQPNLPFTGQK